MERAAVKLSPKEIKYMKRKFDELDGHIRRGIQILARALPARPQQRQARLQRGRDRAPVRNLRSEPKPKPQITVGAQAAAAPAPVAKAESTVSANMMPGVFQAPPHARACGPQFSTSFSPGREFTARKKSRK